ncbi:MAG: SDR family oxidoreductase [Bacillota bacterium]
MKEPRTVLITGASTGIGAAIALRLAREGYRVFGTTRRLKNLENAPPALRAATAEAGGGASFRYPIRFVELDVTDPATIAAALEQVYAEAGRIDVLINNAGWGTFGSVEELPVETARALFDVLVFGPLRMIQAVVPRMRERREGTVINITSIAARAVIPFQAHYSAAKAALEALTIGLRQELLPFGVRVVAVAPTDINTRFNDVTVFAPAKDSPYRPWSEPCWRVIDENLKKAPPPAVVAAKVAAILKCPQPRPVYTVGIPLQRLAPIIFRLIPKSLEIFLMRLFYGVRAE